jgi:two-component system sensor histidine kinase MprB
MRSLGRLYRHPELDPDQFRLEAGAPAHRADEISRLSASITAMLLALRASREQQHRLVLDASHEFRTPLTSLRTNVDLLNHPGLDAATGRDRHRPAD